MQLGDEDLYKQLKNYERELELLDIQVLAIVLRPVCAFTADKEEYIKDEMKNLKREMIRAKEVRNCCDYCALVSL